MTDVLEKGKEVKILSESNGWYKVKNSDGKTGWFYGKFIKASDDEIEGAKSKISGKVTKYLNFRKGPSTDYKVKKVFTNGEEVKILSKSNVWYKVQCSDGKTGWT